MRKSLVFSFLMLLLSSSVLQCAERYSLKFSMHTFVKLKGDLNCQYWNPKNVPEVFKGFQNNYDVIVEISSNGKCQGEDSSSSANGDTGSLCKVNATFSPDLSVIEEMTVFSSRKFPIWEQQWTLRVKNIPRVRIVEDTFTYRAESTDKDGKNVSLRPHFVSGSFEFVEKGAGRVVVEEFLIDKYIWNPDKLTIGVYNLIENVRIPEIDVQIRKLTPAVPESPSKAKKKSSKKKK